MKFKKIETGDSDQMHTLELSTLELKVIFNALLLDQLSNDNKKLHLDTLLKKIDSKIKNNE